MSLYSRGYSTLKTSNILKHKSKALLADNILYLILLKNNNICFESNNDPATNKHG